MRKRQMSARWQKSILEMDLDIELCYILNMMDMKPPNRQQVLGRYGCMKDCGFALGVRYKKETWGEMAGPVSNSCSHLYPYEMPDR
jgi:hypothetical protein